MENIIKREEDIEFKASPKPPENKTVKLRIAFPMEGLNKRNGNSIKQIRIFSCANAEQPWCFLKDFSMDAVVETRSDDLTLTSTIKVSKIETLFPKEVPSFVRHLRVRQAQAELQEQEQIVVVFVTIFI